VGILDTFFLMFEADTSKVDKGIKESDKQAKSLTETLKQTDFQADKLGNNFLALAKKGAGLLGVGLSLAAITKGVAETAASYTQLDKLAQQFRSTADAVDEFQDAGYLLGLSNEDTTGGLKALEATMQDTMLGLGRAKKVYEELGIEVTDAGGKVKSTVAFMGELQEKFRGMDRGTQMRVMERLGLNPGLIKLFNADMADLQKRMADVDRATGFSMEKALKRSAEYTKANKAMGLEVKTLGLYFEKFMDVLKINAMPVFTAALQKVTEVLKTLVTFVLTHQRFIEGVFVAIGAAILYFLVPAAVSGAMALWAMIAPFLLVGAIVVAVAGLFALLYDDIMNFIDGNDSLIGQILSKYPMITDVVMAMVDVVKALGGAVQWTFETMISLLQIAFNLWAKLIGGIYEFSGLGALVGFIVDGWAGKFQGLGQIAGDVLDWILKKVGQVVDVIGSAINLIRGAGAAVTGALGGAKVSLGMSGPTADGLNAGKGVLAAASSAPLGATTSSSINNQRAGDKSVAVTTGPISIQTQATDAAGISKALGDSMQTQMRQAVANYDDGVAI